MIISYIRTILLYGVLIMVIRLMGKRQIGQMEPSEFVVTMLVANLASIPMQDSAIPLFGHGIGAFRPFSKEHPSEKATVRQAGDPH